MEVSSEGSESEMEAGEAKSKKKRKKPRSDEEGDSEGKPRSKKRRSVTTGVGDTWTSLDTLYSGVCISSS